MSGGSRESISTDRSASRISALAGYLRTFDISDTENNEVPIVRNLLNSKSKHRILSYFKTLSFDKDSKAGIVNMYPADLEFLILKFHEFDIFKKIESTTKTESKDVSNTNSSFFSYIWTTSAATSNLITSSSTPISQSKTIELDLIFIYKFFQSITAFKLTKSEFNVDISKPINLYLTIPNLTKLDFVGIDFSIINDWETIGSKLISFKLENLSSNLDDFFTADKIYFPNVKTLSISKSNLSSISEKVIKNFPKSTFLDLSNNKFEYIPLQISFLDGLKGVNMFSNSISSLTNLVPYFQQSVFTPPTEINLINANLTFITILCLASNCLENLEGIEQLISLKVLDISDNRVWDVYEVGRLSSLENVDEILIKGNPLTKLENYRVNIFMYFKSRALNLLLDGYQPSSNEKRSIRANVTVDYSSSPPVSTLSTLLAANDESFQSTKKKRHVKKKIKRFVMNEINGGSTFPVTEEDRTIAVFGSSIESMNSGFLIARGGSSNTLPEKSSPIEINPDLLVKLDENEDADIILSGTPNSLNTVGGSSELLLGAKLRTKIEDMKLETSSNWMKLYSNMYGNGSKSPPSLDSNNESLKSIASTNTPTSTEVIPKEENSLSENKESTVESAIVVEDLFHNTADLSGLHQTHIPPLPPFHEGTDEKISTGKDESILIHTKAIAGISHIGPYRKLFSYGTEYEELEKSIGSRSHVKFSSNPKTSTRKKILGEVESGSSTDFSLSIEQKDQSQQLPPLLVISKDHHRSICSINDNKRQMPQIFRSESRSGAQSSGSGRSGTSKVPPHLILSRPISHSNKYTKNGSVSSRSSNKYSIAYSYSTFHPSSQYGGSVLAASDSIKQSRAREAPGLLPHSPSIPFLTMTNSLQLFLSFSIFQTDGEKTLSWVPGSYVKQLPVTVSEGPNGSFGVLGETKSIQLIDRKRNEGSALPWLVSTLTKSKLKLNSQSMASSRPFGLMSSLSVSDSQPDSMHNSFSFLAIERLGQVVPIEKPSYILLSDCKIYIFVPTFPFPYHSNDANDPYAQYLRTAYQQIRYDDPTKFINLKYAIPLKKIARIDVGPNKQYFTVHFSKNNVESSVGNGGQLDFSSLVLITRSKSATSNILDQLLPILEGLNDTNSDSNDGVVPDGRVIINYDNSWFVNFVKESLLLKIEKGFKNILFNKFSEFESISTLGLSNSMIGIRKQPNSSWNWFGKIGFTNNIADDRPTAPTENSTITIPDLLINSTDVDTSITEPNPIKAYLHVGWVVSFNYNLETPPLVRSTSFIGTTDYLYLVLERFDVWPPILFSSETPEYQKLNSFLSKSPSSPVENAKGLLSDLISPLCSIDHNKSPCSILKCGRLKDIVRCERWKAWRWTPAKNVVQIGSEASKEACVLQNGCIGRCVGWNEVPVDVVGREPRNLLDQTRTSKINRNLSRNSLLDSSIGSGNAAGWEWWVRVVFRRLVDGLHGDSDGEKEDEYWWDLVFVNIDSANEFLVYVEGKENVEGKETDDGIRDDDDFLQDCPVSGSIQFIIGDD